MIERIINQNQKNKIAYKINDFGLSYDELIEKAKHYGELLKKQGTSPIILYGHKNIDMFISIFACIHSGRAYIPIDLCTPIERINKIINCTSCQLVITNEFLSIDSIDVKSLKELEQYKEQPVNNIVNDIAYIIFTSGSTGNPKGVPISYSNLLNFIKWINTLRPLNEYENINVLNQASFSFDLSVADVYYALSNGHTLVALDKDNQEDYNNIFKIISDNNVNVLVITPTFIKLCMVNRKFNSLNYPSIKSIYFCGEQLEVNTVKSLFERFPDVNIINAYGPTEATSAVSAINVTKDMLNDELLPCGDTNNFATEINIINDEIVLKGVSVFGGYLGEYIGGYYNENNINCFKTGDIGYIKDNYLYCKGRKDSQIKYKGYRIELTDIENNIYKIDGVKQCAVVAKYQNEFTVKMIKAYVVLDNGYSVDYIKDSLKKLIPLYMMPKQIIEMKSLPINCNGKIDRKQLIEL